VLRRNRLWKEEEEWSNRNITVSVGGIKGNELIQRKRTDSAISFNILSINK
jgi:hypothetical protein